MRNIEIVAGFLDKAPAGVTPLSTDGNRLFSYGVVIAEWLGNIIVMPDSSKYYSRTTSRHRNMVKDMATKEGYAVRSA